MGSCISKNSGGHLSEQQINLRKAAEWYIFFAAVDQQMLERVRISDIKQSIRELIVRIDMQKFPDRFIHLVQTKVANANLFQFIPAYELASLTNLQLVQCQITTIEPLSKLGIPNIKSLSLDANYITDFRSLRKMNMSELNELSLFPETKHNTIYRGMPQKYIIKRNYLDNFHSIQKLSQGNFPSVTQVFLPINMSESIRLAQNQRDGVLLDITAAYLMKWNCDNVVNVMLADSGEISHQVKLIYGKNYQIDEAGIFDRDLLLQMEQRGKVGQQFMNKYVMAGQYWKRRRRYS